MELSQVGEFGLIERLRAIVGEPGDGEVWVGDDAAVLRAPAGTILFTTDLLVEGVHFDTSFTGPEDLGYKSLAVNISDVAAMGGVPRRAVVGLGVAPGLEVEWIEALYLGMQECCREFDMAVVGGDVTRSDKIIISVALLGNPAGRLFIERGNARVGDAICVTGMLGESAAGFRLMQQGNRERLDLLKAHLRPTPRVKEVQVLRRHLPSAMIDVSDGFCADLGHICAASGVGVLIQESDLPVVDLAGVDLDATPLQLALGGGEDYELCFTIPQDRCEQAMAAVTEATGTRVAKVGEVVDQSRGRILLVESAETPLEAPGWDHLRV